MTLDEIKADCKLIIGNRTDQDTQILKAINNANLQMSGTLNLPDMRGNSKSFILDLPELDQDLTTQITTALITNTGTVAVTNGSATITGTGTNWSLLVRAKDIFSIDAGVTNYTIASVSGDTGITLTTIYNEDTNPTANYTINGYSDLVSIPASTIFIKALFNKDKVTLLELTSNTFIDSQGFASRGQPTKWTRRGANIKLFPPPDSNYNLRLTIRGKPVVFSVTSPGTTTPEISTLWHEGISLLAQAKILQGLNEFDRSQEIYQKHWVPFMQMRIGILEAEHLTSDTKIGISNQWLTQV